ncbi:antiterminator LoaP [Roseburia hominis]
MIRLATETLRLTCSKKVFAYTIWPKGGIPIWYALYCPRENEQDVIQMCREHLTHSAAKDIFAFTYDRMRKYQGTWHLEKKPMFPDYVFLESEDSGKLYEELRNFGKMANVQDESTTFTPVTPEEEEMLRRLCGRQHHLKMSRGIIRDGVTLITEGPLIGLENQIRKIDRHKRLARVERRNGNSSDYITAGLEIVEKS